MLKLNPQYADTVFALKYQKPINSITVGQKTVPMLGYFAKIEVEQIKKTS